MPHSVSTINSAYKLHRSKFSALQKELSALGCAEDSSTLLLDQIRTQVTSLGLDPKMFGDSGLTVDVSGQSSSPRLAVVVQPDVTSSKAFLSRIDSASDQHFRYSFEIAESIIGLGVLTLLVELGSQMPVSILVIFDAGKKETDRGNEHPLSGDTLRRLGAIYGLSLTSRLSKAEAGVSRGPISQSLSRLRIRLYNKDSRTTRGDETLVYAAAQTVVALRQLVARKIDPLTPATISLSSISGQDDSRTPAGAIVLGGDVRTAHETVQSEMPALIEGAVRTIADACGIDYRLELVQEFPTVCSDVAITTNLLQAAGEILGVEHVRRLEFLPTASNGFSDYFQASPATILYLGTDSNSCHRNPTEPPNHFSQMIEVGVKALTWALIRHVNGAVPKAEELRAYSTDCQE